MRDTAMRILLILTVALGAAAARGQPPSDKTGLVYPLVPGHGGVVPLPEAAEQPRKGAKAVFDVTADAKPSEVNRGLEQIARLLNLYGAAGLKAGDVKIAAVFHGEADKAVLSDAAYAARFKVPANPNLPVIRDLKKMGVEVFVCGQSLHDLGFKAEEVAEDVPVADSAMLVLVNKQADGYAYIPASGATQQDAGKPPPIPEAGPLAQPRSLQQVGLPADATRTAAPADNPQTPEKSALGMKLFFDGRLSADGTVACATCHDPARAFTDGRPGSVGIKGRVGQRNAPTILNALYNKTQFWDGRATTLEEQAALPIVNPMEMGQPNLDAAVDRVAEVEEYRQAFQRVFGRPPNGPDLLRALASYERTQVSFDSPFDHFIAGDKDAIDDSAKRGWELFNAKARCNKCHALSEDKRDVTFFTDNDFHNIGVGIIRHNVVALAGQAKQLIKSGDTEAIDRAAIENDMSALGRFLVTKKDADIASFKTPDLRNVLVTGPYFHDGSHETLWDVMDHYNKGDGLENPYLDEDIQPLALTEQDIDDVVAFMASLTSPDYKDLAAKELARQRELSRTNRPQRDTKRAFGPKPPRPKPPAP